MTRTPANLATAPAPPPPPRFLRTPEAARFLGLSGRTLEKHRSYGTGPVYRKLGGRIVYAIDDLQRWANRGLRTATDDPYAGVIRPARPFTDDVERAAFVDGEETHSEPFEDDEAAGIGPAADGHADAR